MILALLNFAAGALLFYLKGRDDEKFDRLKRPDRDFPNGVRMGCDCKTCRETRDRERAERGEAYA